MRTNEETTVQVTPGEIYIVEFEGGRVDSFRAPAEAVIRIDASGFANLFLIEDSEGAEIPILDRHRPEFRRVGTGKKHGQNWEELFENLSAPASWWVSYPTKSKGEKVRITIEKVLFP